MPTTWRVYKDNRQLASKDWGPLLYLLLVYARTSKIEHCLAWDDRAEGIFSVHFEELKALIETEIEEDDPEDAAEGGDDGGGKGADADDVREGKGKKSLSSDKKAARGARASPAKRRETIVTTGATSFEHLQVTFLAPFSCHVPPCAARTPACRDRRAKLTVRVVATRPRCRISALAGRAGGSRTLPRTRPAS